MVKPRFPHDNVYVRLRCSGIHGVGVFAIRDIPQGTEIFCGNTSRTVIVERSVAEAQDKEIRELYEDFCALEGDKYYCPDSFNNLDVSYFLNESKESNVTTPDGHCFFAARHITKEEELTVDYSAFSEK
jgi:SET domain-containing protein